MTSRAAGMQAISYPLRESVGYNNSVLDAAFTGGTANNCLRFNGAGAITPNFVVEATTVADGTTVTISDAGIYEVELTGSSVDAVSNIWGLSLGANAVVSGTVAFLTNGCFQASQQITILNETRSFTLRGLAILTTLRAKATASLTSANVFRGVASASAGGAPTGVVAANVVLRINKIDDSSN